MRFAAACRQADSLLASVERSSARVTLARSSARPIGFSMKSSAPAFMAWTAIGTSLKPVIMMEGGALAHFVQPLEQFEPVHAGQIGIDQQAAFAAGTIGFEKGFAGRIGFDEAAGFLEHGANSVAYVAVVVDDEDDGLVRGGRRLRRGAERARVPRLAAGEGAAG